MKTKPNKLEYQRAYRQANSARIHAYQKEYRERRKQTSPGYMAEYMRGWRKSQKQYDIALNKLMLLYVCDQITIEAVKEILQPICKAKLESSVPDDDRAGVQPDNGAGTDGGGHTG